MNYVKNLAKILLFVQCFLFCACGNKGSISLEIPTEEQKLRLADFKKCPFNEEFTNKTDLEKYVLKKFGKPDTFYKWSGKFGEHSEVTAYFIQLHYKNKYEFEINKVINRKFQFFDTIFLLDFPDLKYGINKDTTIKDIESLFGKSREFTDVEDSYIIYYSYEDNDGPYYYSLKIAFSNKKLSSISVETRLNTYKL
jgi:hypothetical protein